ncbi:hypothetical protein BABINDRAFT_163934 [Babjeviella inositovora NRRL Y-12698]|uniref:J domain-containing protein n=1 Tax=Babjeviella inositovora NRRL Y-12698 TaxID=984486 RepID=A0A1E3QH23_9ASCO|nr:uncharacterized protein BABINDRAFT_163934 [Babjeviella inositovora NRRL Y-12698]ODQ76930.1 hypothetical protein BABINDRAFT_163934 [Babjeviella inositovora NRRL Y-12698]
MSSSIPFPDINPYLELGLEDSREVTPQQIRTTYKKLCLKYHPDKLAQRKVSESVEKETFERIQFAYSILNDITKRKVFDETKSVRSVFDAEFSNDNDTVQFWRDYFRDMRDEVTVELIEEDRAKYQGSEEERTDILKSFLYYNGDFLNLFEVIPHLEFTREEETRVYDLIVEEIANEDSVIDTDEPLILKKWTHYKRNRLKLVARELKKVAKEAKELEALQAELQINKGKVKVDSEDALKKLIMSKKQTSFDSLINKLESKYGGKEKSKKRARELKESELDDDEFERIQREMLAKSAKGPQKAKRG